MSLIRTVAPAVAPVTLAQLQAHLKLEAGEDDAQIQHCLDVAVAQFDGPDGELGRALIGQTWQETFAAVPASGAAVELGLSPVSDLVSAQIVDANGTWSDVVAPELFELGGRYLVSVESWGIAGPARDKLRITYVAGFGALAEDVPLPIRHAILLFATHLYRVREPVVFGAAPVEVPLSISRLVAPYKIWWS
ncbi:head-tail connector protein [Pseudodonghicola flavimaris]|uniref:Phage gp6-like head-tail connector protein n=1 Tax=Pseudodonghicola flavimaris TaxID=3050036 RepID=A0ABT7EZ49_9RHOB|nr:hypothetical protein [Pseudodonghicola flavimaris]MDK3017621.1 hypothetical protein [Pseudodonghicola flavimaris]